MRAALAVRDIGKVFRLLRESGVPQRRIAAMTGHRQSEVAEIVKGRGVWAYDVLERIADGLGVPRGYLGLAYDETTVAPVDEEEAAKRRKFLAHAYQVTMGAAVFGSEPGTSPWRRPVPERIGMVEVRQVEAATRAFRTLEQQYGGEFCRSAAEAELVWADELLEAGAAAPVKARLVEAVIELEAFCRALAEARSTAATPEPDGPPAVVPRRPVARASQRAAEWASRAVPAVERERYFDEYLSELDDLAQSARPRRAQLLYVLRLFSRLPALRFALRDSKARELAR